MASVGTSTPASYAISPYTLASDKPARSSPPPPDGKLAGLYWWVWGIIVVLIALGFSAAMYYKF